MLKHTAVIFLMVSLFSRAATSKSGEVKVLGGQILVNGAQYTIKGACYHSVPKGKETGNFLDLTEDLDLMVEAGIDTLKVYEPIIKKSVLDEIDQAGLKVIIGFGYDQGGENDILSGSFINYANATGLESVFNTEEVCSGVDLFSLTDSWWKAGDKNRQNLGGWAPNSTGVPYDGTPDEGYWGILDMNRKKKQTYNVIQSKYTNIPD